MPSQQSAKDLVLACIDAFNREDFPAARELVDDHFQFNGVMGSRDGAEAYFADMKKMKFKYDVKKALGDEQDVCTWSEMPMQGRSILVASWYRVQHGKITSLRVVFDPRPLLEQASNKEKAADRSRVASSAAH
jgi:hypothetical protein